MHGSNECHAYIFGTNYENRNNKDQTKIQTKIQIKIKIIN